LVCSPYTKAKLSIRRIVNSKSKLAEKLECGAKFISKQRKLEGIEE